MTAPREPAAPGGRRAALRRRAPAIGLGASAVVFASSAWQALSAGRVRTVTWVELAGGAVGLVATAVALARGRRR